jgi:hypothetical protein
MLVLKMMNTNDYNPYLRPLSLRNKSETSLLPPYPLPIMAHHLHCIYKTHSPVSIH